MHNFTSYARMSDGKVYSKTDVISSSSHTDNLHTVNSDNLILPLCHAIKCRTSSTSLSCDNCCTPIGDYHLQIDYLECDPPSFFRKHKDTKYFVRCNGSGCNRMYCSQVCKDRRVFHQLVCSDCKFNRKFIQHSLRTNQIFVIIVEMLTCILDQTIDVCNYTGQSDTVLESTVQQTIDSLLACCADKPIGSMIEDDSGECEESYLLLQSSLLNNDNGDDAHHHTHTVIVEQVKALLSRVLTYKIYCTMIHVTQRNLVKLTVETPLFKAIKAFPSIKRHTDRADLYRKVDFLDRKSYSASIDDSDESKIKLERRILDMYNGVDALQVAHADFYCLYKPTNMYRHSCAPNVCVEMSESNTHNLVALYDIHQGDECTISYHYRYMAEDCDCHLCLLRNMSLNTYIKKYQPCKSKLKLLASALIHDQYVHKQQLSLELYRRILELDTTDGDAYYTLGAALIEVSRGSRWSEAYALWREGLMNVPCYQPLIDQCRKMDDFFSYTSATTADATISVTGSIMNMDQFDRIKVRDHDNKSIFISKEMIISDAECKFYIDASEAFAATSGGWTTFRHAAVPTTDIPVNRIPSLLVRFNALLKDVVYPMMLMQYTTHTPSNTCDISICCHDAFLVKYEYSEDTVCQRNLPTHTDQSTHSLTISLNACDEYSGGGTYFDDLKRSIIIDKGKILSFPGGSLLHGGDSLIGGKRYIIAAFIFIECKQRVAAAHSVLVGSKRSLPWNASTCQVTSPDAMAAADVSAFCFNFDE